MAEIRFVGQGHEILGYWGEDPVGVEDTPVGFIAEVARTCYKSKPKDPRFHSPYSDVRIDAQRDADETLVMSLVRRDHGAMLDHSFLSVRFVADRAVANELVRHRHFSFAQESTRYVNASKRGFEFILPPGLTEEQERITKASCIEAVQKYEALVELFDTKPEIARSVLPLCTATTIVCSGNFREWRHMLKLRTARDAHPSMRALMQPLLEELRTLIPIVFDDVVR